MAARVVVAPRWLRVSKLSTPPLRGDFMRSIDIKIEQARKRAEAEKKRQPIAHPPTKGLTDTLNTPRFDPAKPKVTSPPAPTTEGEDWGICCAAVGWFVKHNRSNP